jgi:hypothetical protein
MTFPALRQWLLSSPLLLTVVLAGGLQTARADCVAVSVQVFGNGPSEDEYINGTFLFDPQTGIGTNFNFTGHGLVSESWSFGPLMGSPQEVSVGVMGYVFNLNPEIGSEGDQLAFEVVLSPTVNFVPADGGGGGPNFNSIDSWGGSVTVSPEPSSMWFFWQRNVLNGPLCGSSMAVLRCKKGRGVTPLRKLLTIALCLSFPLSVLAGENGYKVKYDGGTIPDIKTGSELRMEIQTNQIQFVKGKGEVVQVIPASAVTEISYGQDVHRRVGAAIGLAVVSFGVGALMALTKSKKHYIGLTWQNGDQKGGFAMQADKSDYRGILTGLEGVTGKKAVDTDAMNVKN